jgi:hypothetical protein
MRRGAYSTPYLSLFYLKGYILHNFRDGISKLPVEPTSSTKKDINSKSDHNSHSPLQETQIADKA